MASFPRIALVGVLFAASVALDHRTIAAQEERYRNLEVLPADISRDELNEIMLANLRGLGLPRLGGEGCLFCHEGDMDTPRDQWDYASDAKPTKAKARVMLAMVRAINEQYLAELDHRVDAHLQVTCATCHAGRTDPRPLPTVLQAAYATGGIDSLVARYRGLRERYFGADAYDFRTGTLIGVAVGLADRGAIDDAIAVAALNADVNANDRVSQQAWVQLTLERTIDAQGVDAALRQLEAMSSELRTGVYGPDLLNNLGWRLMRSNRQAKAVALFEENFRRFPGEYIPLETMAFVFADSQPERAFALLEGWLAEHPDHDRGRQLLINLRRRRR